MFEEHDKVIYKPTGEAYFIIAVDDDDGDVIYGIEQEDQESEDWFKWCTEDEIELVG